jgi:glycosyltransferase involved in cell wall biosynthesis
MRFVFDQHDLNPEVYASRFGRQRGPLYAGLLALERAAYAVADHVISTNESYRDVALRRGRRHDDTVSVVRSGPDAERMQRGAPVPSLRKGRKHLLVWLGIMGPQDGVDGVLHAMRSLVDRGRDDVHLALLGFGDCLDELRALATDLDLDDHVTFTGRVGPDQIRDYLSTASVGLSPDPMSPLNDVSTMNKTLEYMAHELPVVAFDLKETQVSAGDAAVYVRSGDIDGYAAAVAELLDDSERRREMGLLGRRRIEDEFAWQHQAPRYVEVYRELLARPRRPRSFPFAHWRKR